MSGRCTTVVRLRSGLEEVGDGGDSGGNCDSNCDDHSSEGCDGIQFSSIEILDVREKFSSCRCGRYGPR
jgi:hypothetical protein